ncbi:MAG: HIT domain-containing protein [Uliginosibacterium sp.]|nr:HIT domain-containing protein [Uliginosibacterium sp.]
MTKECRFCEIALGKKALGQADQIVAETENFFAIPSIGSLVEGWTLVVPKSHEISLRDLYTSEDFQYFVRSTAQKINSAYGSVIAFEHGPNAIGSKTGCGTDHAHLHIVPFSALTKNDVISASLNFKKINPNQIKDVVKNDEYLVFFEDILNNSGECFLSVLEVPHSQYFRHLIARKIGIESDQVDYRTSPRVEVSVATSTRLLSIQG